MNPVLKYVQTAAFLDSIPSSTPKVRLHLGCCVLQNEDYCRTPHRVGEMRRGRMIEGSPLASCFGACSCFYLFFHSCITRALPSYQPPRPHPPTGEDYHRTSA
jgi:hypothetical protein